MGLFDGGKQKSESKTELPWWLKEGSKNAVSRATDLSNREYTPFSGDRVADANSNMMSAYNKANALTSLSDPFLNKSADALGRANQSFNGANLSSYMNPYTTAVTDVAARHMNDAFERSRQANNNQSAAHGAFGGLRSEIGNQLSEDGYLQNVGDLYTTNLSNAWNQAANQWASDRSNNMAVGQQYGNLASMAQGLGQNEIGALEQTGQNIYGVDNAQDQADYADYLDKRSWDANNLGLLTNTLASVPHGSTTTNTQQNKMGVGNYVMAGIGAGTAALGAFGGMGGGGGATSAPTPSAGGGLGSLSGAGGLSGYWG